MISKVLKWVAAMVLLFVIGSLGFIQYIGAWNIVFPSHQHETVAPKISDRVAPGAVLVFTKTNSFRHKEAIPAGVAFFQSLAIEKGWSLFHTENGAVFNARDLSRFSLVIFHNTSGDTLSIKQQMVFQSWLNSGGGWLGVHAAGDNSHKDWPWYLKTLIGANFIGHPMTPQFQVATVSNELPENAVMAKLPTSWSHEEEWYSWDKSVRGKGFTVLASIDESSYSPIQKMMGKETDLHMGDHPVVWNRCIGKGRAIYSALGHQAKAYSNKEHRQLLENAIVWAMDTRSCP